MTTFTTTNSPATLIEMFLDNTSGEVYNQGRLSTRETETGVQLIAYGNEVLAHLYNDRDIDLYLGHYKQVSPTVSGYIEDLGSLLNDKQSMKVNDLEGVAPTLGEGTRASRSAQYITNYINWTTNLSDVEKDARAEVNRALKSRMSAIFG